MPVGETPKRRTPRRSREGGPSRLDQRTRAARAQGREPRDELLSAALRVFARRGYRHAGVDEIAAAEAPRVTGKVFNIASGRRTTLLELLHIINENLGRNIRPIHDKPRPGDVRHSQAES